MLETSTRSHWCTECGEPARPLPPHPWQPALTRRPAFSHLDGSPLCPVMGVNDYEPSSPTQHDPATE